MNYQVLFSLENNKKKYECCLLCQLQAVGETANDVYSTHVFVSEY